MSRTKVRQVGIGIVLHEFLDERGIGGFQVAGIVPESGADICRQVTIGDIVLAVDGVKVCGRSLIEVAKLFSGPSGTSIAITLKRRTPDQPSPPERPSLPSLPNTAPAALVASDSPLAPPPAPAAASGEGAGSGGARYRSLTVNVTRIDFSSDEERYVSWIQAAEAERAAAGMGNWLLDRVAPRGGEALRGWGAQLREHIHRTHMVDTIAAQVSMARQLATSAALPVLNTLGDAAPAPAAPDPHPRRHVMRMYTCPDHYVVFPPAAGAGPGAAPVVVERGSMTARAASTGEAERLASGRAKIEILGILGLARMQHAAYLIVVTRRAFVAALPQGDVYRVAGCEIRVIGSPGSLSEADPRRVIEYRLLQELLGTCDMIFSYDFDITQTQQRLAQRGIGPAPPPAPPSYESREARFVWNQHVLKPLAACHASGCLLPVACGFAKAVEMSTPGGRCTVVLLARREWQRVGYRYQSRGMDAAGFASNSVETEQILVTGGSRPRVSSMVIVRGSVPLLWQEADSFMALKPRPELEEEDRHLAPCRLHLSALTRAYGRVDLLSLIEEAEGSSEAKLGTMLQRTIETLQAEGTCGDVRYHAFDFHKRCGKLSFQDLPLLLDVCRPSADDFGFFVAGEREQTGVFRVNCIDCLDRTNVAQSVIAFRALLHQLAALDLIQPDQMEACMAAFGEERPLPMDWAQTLHQQLKELWGDHGDAVSIQYAGTNALKGDLTRTGRRTVGGLWQDGVRSLKRCVQNNFADAHRQQVVETFQGILLPGTPAPPTHTPANAAQLPRAAARRASEGCTPPAAGDGPAEGPPHSPPPPPPPPAAEGAPAAGGSAAAGAKHAHS